MHSKIQAAAKSKGQTDTFYFYLLLLITEKKKTGTICIKSKFHSRNIWAFWCVDIKEYSKHWWTVQHFSNHSKVNKMKLGFIWCPQYVHTWIPSSSSTSSHCLWSRAVGSSSLEWKGRTSKGNMNKAHLQLFLCISLAVLHEISCRLHHLLLLSPNLKHLGGDPNMYA